MCQLLPSLSSLHHLAPETKILHYTMGHMTRLSCNFSLYVHFNLLSHQFVDYFIDGPSHLEFISSRKQVAQVILRQHLDIRVSAQTFTCNNRCGVFKIVVDNNTARIQEVFRSFTLGRSMQV